MCTCMYVCDHIYIYIQLYVKYRYLYRYLVPLGSRDLRPAAPWPPPRSQLLCSFDGVHFLDY